MIYSQIVRSLSKLLLTEFKSLKAVRATATCNKKSSWDSLVFINHAGL